MKINTTATSQQNYNVSKESEEYYILRLLGYFFVGCVVFYIVFLAFAYALITFIPLETEMKWFSDIDTLDETLGETPEWIIERYKDLPYTFSLIQESGEKNAYSTLGWHIYLTQEFLDTVKNYETLDFVVGHEIGHIEHRDFLKNIIPTLPIHIIFSLWGAQELSSIFTWLIENPFNKQQEINADMFGLDFTYQKNAHIGCALDFFKEGNTLKDNILEMFSEHPMTQNRIKKAEAYIQKKWYTQTRCTPILN